MARRPAWPPGPYHRHLFVDFAQLQPPWETQHERVCALMAFAPGDSARQRTLEEMLELLIGEKTEQTVETLSGIWRIKPADALDIATQLVEIGFFERRGSKEEPSFWVPFLYREALRMVQGSAE